MISNLGKCFIPANCSSKQVKLRVEKMRISTLKSFEKNGSTRVIDEGVQSG